jgi:hypothetical protein
MQAATENESVITPSWRRFVSEAESQQMIGRIMQEKSAAEAGRANLDQKVKEIAERFSTLGTALQRRLVGRARAEDEAALSKLLRFGEESGVNVDGLAEMLRERDRLAGAVEDCKRRLLALGINP